MAYNFNNPWAKNPWAENIWAKPEIMDKVLGINDISSTTNQSGIFIKLNKNEKDEIKELSINVVGKINFENLPSSQRDKVIELNFEREVNNSFIRYLNKKSNIDGIKYSLASNFSVVSKLNPVNEKDIVIHIVDKKEMPGKVAAFVNLIGGRKIYTPIQEDKLSIAHELGHILGWQHPDDYNYFDTNIQKDIVPLLFGTTQQRNNIMNGAKDPSYTQVFPFQYFISYILYQANQLNAGDNTYNFSIDRKLENKQPQLLAYTRDFLAEYAASKNISKAYNKYITTK